MTELNRRDAIKTRKNSTPTPQMLGYITRLEIPPKNGWKPDTYYIVDAAFSANNPIHRKIFYTGFLDDKGAPCGYNGFAKFSGGDYSYDISDVYYIKAIREIDMEI